MLLCVFSNERTLAKALEAEEQVGFIVNGRNDDGGESDVLAGKGVGQKLISHHCSFLFCDAQCVHCAYKRFLGRLSAIGIGKKTERAVESLHAGRVIIGYQCRLDAVLREKIKPSVDPLVGVGLLIGG